MRQKNRMILPFMLQLYILEQIAEKAQCLIKLRSLTIKVGYFSEENVLDSRRYYFLDITVHTVSEDNKE